MEVLYRLSLNRCIYQRHFLLRLSWQALYHHKGNSLLAALCSGHSLRNENLVSPGVVSISSKAPEEPYI